MAASSLPLLVLLTLSIFFLAVSARPCKTLFFYTSSTTSYYPTTPTYYSLNPNPNPNFNIFPLEKSSYSPKFLTLFFTNTNARDNVGNRLPLNFRFHSYPNGFVSIRRYPFPLYSSRQEFLDEEVVDSGKRSAASVMPLGFYSSVTRSSLRDRTRDIMSVVGSLLFGVGCGALTAATMYLIWSLSSPNRLEFDDSDDDDFDDDICAKKMGYLAIPDDIDAEKKAAQAKMAA